MRNVDRTLEEQLRNEAEAVLSMWLRRDSHAIGARSFKERRKPEWPNRGLWLQSGTAHPGAQSVARRLTGARVRYIAARRGRS